MRHAGLSASAELLVFYSIMGDLVKKEQTQFLDQTANSEFSDKNGVQIRTFLGQNPNRYL